jgi:hypothetical protein
MLGEVGVFFVGVPFVSVVTTVVAFAILTVVPNEGLAHLGPLMVFVMGLYWAALILCVALPILLAGAVLLAIARRGLGGWKWLPFLTKPRLRASWVIGLVAAISVSVPLTLNGPRLLDRIMGWVLLGTHGL